MRQARPKAEPTMSMGALGTTIVSASAQRKFAQRLLRAPSTRMFLDPASAPDTTRVRLRDTFSKDSCPVYQRVSRTATTIDVGSNQQIAVMLNPSTLCPLLISTPTVPTNTRFELFNGSEVRNGRLIDPVGGIHVCTGSNVPVPDFKTMEIPSSNAFSVGEKFWYPLHDSFGTSTDSTTTTATATSLICPTAVLSNGTPTGSIGIPVNPGMGVSQCGTLLSETGNLLRGNFLMTYGYVDASGTYFEISAAMDPLVDNVTRLDFFDQTPVPANAVALVAVGIQSLVAATVVLRDIGVTLNTFAQTSIPLGVSLGHFSGSPISGFNSLKPLVTDARVIAASLLISNTASSLNANGTIYSSAVNGFPSNYGIVSAESIAEKTSTTTLPFVDGTYCALNMGSRAYSSFDTTPDPRAPRCISFIGGQDSTPVSFKAEVHLVVECVSEDPLFPAESEPFVDYKVIQSAFGSEPALLLCENKFHLRKVLEKLMKAAGVLSKPLMEAPHPIAQGLGKGLDTMQRLGEAFGLGSN